MGAYLTVKQAAAELGGVSCSTVYALCQAGRLDHIRVGVGRGTIRIPRESVDQLKEQGRVVSKAGPPLRHLRG
jgi:excisionase family DNA binding protein